MSSAIAEWVEGGRRRRRPDRPHHAQQAGPALGQGLPGPGQAARFVVVPKHIWKDQDPKTFGFFDLAKGWPVGTGPYRWCGAGPDAIVFDRRDTWWAVETRSPRACRRVRAGRLPAGDRRGAAAALRQRRARHRPGAPGRQVRGRAGPQPAARLLAQGRPGVRGAPDGCMFRLFFNNQKAPFDDAEVRWAMNHALNRQQIVDLAFEGSMPKAVLPFSSYRGRAAVRRAAEGPRRARAPGPAGTSRRRRRS